MSLGDWCGSSVTLLRFFAGRALNAMVPKTRRTTFAWTIPKYSWITLKPEDVESSSLFVDYLTIDDEDMLMPPESHGGPLKPGELALIRVWIEEGANWPEDYQFTEGRRRKSEPNGDRPPPKRFRNEFGWPKVSCIRRRFISRSRCFFSGVDLSCWVGSGPRWEPKSRWLVS